MFRGHFHESFTDLSYDPLTRPHHESSMKESAPSKCPYKTKLILSLQCAELACFLSNETIIRTSECERPGLGLQSTRSSIPVDRELRVFCGRT